MGKELALVELLHELFTAPKRLQHFLYFLPVGTSVASNLLKEVL
jgi:hypothetical protein